VSFAVTVWALMEKVNCARAVKSLQWRERERETANKRAVQGLQQVQLDDPIKYMYVI